MDKLSDLHSRVVQCVRCPRLVTHREAVACKKRRMYLDWDYWGKPLPSFGDPNARLLIVGLAPAAHGANRTGRMFTGDDSGDFLFRTLHKLGFANHSISRHTSDGMLLTDAYITSVARCAPPQNKPLATELNNCKSYLRDELSLLLNLQVVIALGKIAFDAFLVTYNELNGKLPSPRPKFGHGITFRLEGITLMAAYHPSRQNTQTGRLNQRMFSSVFREARETLI